MTTVRQLLDRKGSGGVSLRPEAPVLEAIPPWPSIMSRAAVMKGEVLAGSCPSAITPAGDPARALLQRHAVRDIMTSPVLTVSPDTSVEQCMQLVTDKRVRHLPVVEAGRVVGMVSIGDLVKAVIAEQQQQIQQLESYIHS